MKPFVLRATLVTPVFARGSLTLDALLMSIRQCGDVSDVLCVERELYKASAAFPVHPIPVKGAFVASMRAEHTPQWSEVIASNARGGDVRFDPKRQRDGGNVVNNYTGFAASCLEWYAVGHARKVLSLLADVAFVGKKRTAGYGEVAAWTVEDGELDGIVGYAGEPLRPVPTERWTAGGDWIPVEAAWKAPYWDPRNRTRCFVPERGV